MPLIIIALVTTLIITWVLIQPKMVKWRRARIMKQPIPDHWIRLLRKNLPYYSIMPNVLQKQLLHHMQVFIAEKNFVGCAGLTIEEPIRVLVAAQACLLLLNRETRYFPKLKDIFIYPAAFYTSQQVRDHSGIVHEGRRIHAGESWESGRVILSWQDTLSGAFTPDDGQNLVIHEFAHQLDQETGSSNGAPFLNKGQNYDQWTKVFSFEYEQLKRMAHENERTLLDKYGATNPAEFFAVSSEMFFECPKKLRKFHEALYHQLADFYNIDPANWGKKYETLRQMG